MQPSCELSMMRLYAAAGWRNVMLNLELEPITEPQVVSALAAMSQTGITPFIKMPNLDPEISARYLHFGVRNFILPHVSDVAPVHAVRDRLKQVHWVDDGAIRLYPLIESAAGVKQIPKICAVDGVAGAMIGPFDLGNDLGFHIRTLVDFDASRAKLMPILSDALDAIRACGKPNGCGLTPAWFASFPMDRIDWLWLQLGDVASPPRFDVSS